MALYDNVVAVAATYMGPAAERFVSRQISAHLSVSPTDLAAQHMDELAKWIMESGKLVMDEAKAVELSQKVKTMK